MMGRSTSPGGAGVIFDLDGTLTDTLDDLARAVNHAVRDTRDTPWTREQIRPLIGEGLTTLIARASCVDDETRVARMVDSFRAYYSDHLLDATRLYSGVAELLDALAAKPVPLAVLSNKPDDFTRRIVEALLGRVPFVCVRGMTESTPRKPDPTSALGICRRMELPPERVLFVGDSAIDVETGRRAGMRCVAVTWGFRERAELTAARPDFVIDHPAQLLTLDTPLIDR
jgi:phosphoglycolate phosphatase